MYEKKLIKYNSYLIFLRYFKDTFSNHKIYINFEFYKKFKENEFIRTIFQCILKYINLFRYKKF